MPLLWSGDGLSLVYSCGEDDRPQVFDALAAWHQSFSAALSSLEPPADFVPESEWDDSWMYDYGCEYWDEETPWYEDECLSRLSREYASYLGAAVSQPSQSFSQSSVSANQIALLAQGPEDENKLYFGLRHAILHDAARWQAIELEAQEPANPVWAPNGQYIAFDALVDDQRTIITLKTDYYLQSVRNLNAFPELYSRGESKLLQENAFVARMGASKEFFEAYEKLRYARRPQFVTADAALQLFVMNMSGP